MLRSLAWLGCSPWGAVALLALGAGCDRGERAHKQRPSASDAAGASVSASTRPGASAPASARDPQTAAEPGRLDAGKPEPPAQSGGGKTCPSDMLRVEGQFCPESFQHCLKYHPEYEANPKVSDRCLRFQQPSRCLSKARVPLAFCIDRYEWPNREGEKPLVLVSWTAAKQACEGAGKRLCDEAEWLFACEGEDMLPHAYGFARDPSKCQIDREYRKREKSLKPYAACLADASCRAEFEKLDQRVPAGTNRSCISPFGVYDMNGSVNEWVNVPGRRYPHRSGLKGGWWGPVRNRCRPTVLFHKEDDWGYEAGFRCCRSLAAARRAGDADASGISEP